MKLIGSLCWLCYPTVFLLGCASTEQSLNQLQLAQSEAAAVLQQQSEQLYLQQQRIARLESDKQVLVDRVFDLQQELKGINDTDGAPAQRSASQKQGKRAANSKRESAFDKVVLGRLEWVWFDLFNRYVQTRIDTGVKYSSIYASNIRYFERDGDEWVRFDYQFKQPKNSQEQGETVTLEAPVAKKVRFKNGSSTESSRRSAVRLRTKVGELVDDSLFLLIEKDAPMNSVVMGRTFLRDIAVVDADKTFTQPKN